MTNPGTISTPTRPTGPPPITLLSSPSTPNLIGGVRLCLWAPPFYGKTHAALSWPNPIVIHWDEDANTVLKRNPPVPVLVPTLEQWRQKIIPAMACHDLEGLIKHDPKFANYKVESVIFDSWTKFGQKLVAEGTALNSSNKYFKWDWLLSHGRSAANALNAATHPNSKGKFYHYIATVHEREYYDEDGKLSTIGPSMQGQFGDDFFSQFGTVLALDNSTGADGKTRYFARTCKTALRKQMGDRTGGGLYGTLPSEISPDYLSLMRAWGFIRPGQTAPDTVKDTPV